MTEIEQTSGVSRRTLVKGAAWSVPVIAAATVSPLAAATTPECPNCVKPNYGVFTLAGLATSARASLAFLAVQSLDATDCGFLTNIFRPAFTFAVLSSTLTMSDGNTYNSAVGLGVAGGVLGTPLNPFPGAFAFTNVRVDPSNNRSGLPRTRPAKLTVQVQYTLEFGIGLQLQCPNTYEWDLSALANVSLLVLGTGAVSYTGASQPL